MIYTLNQEVTIKRGDHHERGNFIGYMDDGLNAQVCLMDRKFKPNVIVPVASISDLIHTLRHARRKKPQTPVADPNLEPL